MITCTDYASAGDGQRTICSRLPIVIFENSWMPPNARLHTQTRIICSGEAFCDLSFPYTTPLGQVALRFVHQGEPLTIPVLLTMLNTLETRLAIQNSL